MQVDNHYDDEIKNNRRLECRSLIRVLPKIWRQVAMLYLVYFFEYSIITAFADIIDSKMSRLELTTTKVYVLINVCYQVGVFISRSSLSYFQVPHEHLWVLSALQMMNFLIFLASSEFMFMTSMWVLCPMAIWTGLMGGGSYVNIFHSILTQPGLEQSEKEMATSLALMFNSSGIVTASLFSLWIRNTWFSYLDNQI